MIIINVVWIHSFRMWLSNVYITKSFLHLRFFFKFQKVSYFLDYPYNRNVHGDEAVIQKCFCSIVYQYYFKDKSYNHKNVFINYSILQMIYLKQKIVNSNKQFKIQLSLNTCTLCFNFIFNMKRNKIFVLPRNEVTKILFNVASPFYYLLTDL